MLGERKAPESAAGPDSHQWDGGIRHLAAGRHTLALCDEAICKMRNTDDAI